jgi:type IV pilus assembly protein PilC
MNEVSTTGSLKAELQRKNSFVFDAWSLILLAQIAAVVYAVVLINVAGTLRMGGIADSARYSRGLAWGALAMFLVVVGHVVAFALIVEDANRRRRFGGDDDLIVPVLWFGLNAVLAIGAAVFLLRGSKTLHAERSDDKKSSYRRVSRELGLTGWLILLTPVIFILLAILLFITLSLWGMLLLALIGIAATLIIAGKRRADQAAVLWALAIATERDLPLAEELDAVAGGLSSGHRGRTRRLAELLREGCPLTVALEQTPRVIPRFALLAAQVGDENGTLPAALREAAIRQTRSAESTGGGVSSPTLVIGYLLMLPLFGALIFTGLMYWVVPKYKKIFHSFEMELPDVTKNVIAASDWVAAYSLLVVPLLLLPAAVVFGVAYAHQRGWGEFDPPLFRRLLRRLDVPNLLRNLALTLEADESLHEALAVMSLRHPRKAPREALAEALQALQRGDDCWYALRDAGLLTDHETAVLRAAQRVGNLPWALRALADGMERRLWHRWGAALEVAQPLFVVALGLGCAAIYFAFFMPLLKLIGGLT